MENIKEKILWLSQRAVAHSRKAPANHEQICGRRTRLPARLRRILPPPRGRRAPGQLRGATVPNRLCESHCSDASRERGRIHGLLCKQLLVLSGSDRLQRWHNLILSQIMPWKPWDSFLPEHVCKKKKKKKILTIDFFLTWNQRHPEQISMRLLIN